MEYTYTVIYESAEEGGFLAHVPALNGATTHGETIEQARQWAKDLIQSTIEALLKLGRPIPEEKEKLDGERITVRVAVEVVT